MTSRKQLAIWALFVALNGATWLVEPVLLRSSFYFGGLLTLAGVSVLLGICILRKFGLTIWRAMAVLCLLVLGQWRLLEMLIAFLLWKVGGFAP